MSTKLPELRARMHTVPLQPGVYIMRDRLGHVIYVGKGEGAAEAIRVILHAVSEEAGGSEDACADRFHMGLRDSYGAQ